MIILLVEDDLNLGRSLSRVMSAHYRVQWVRTLEAAKGHFLAADFDLILLDLGLPDGDGADWLRAIRARGSTTPVLIVSARDALDDRILGLDGGADDYVIKPFDGEELLARIRAVLRRQAGSADSRLQSGDLSYESASRQFLLAGAPIEVTPREHELLEALIQAGGRPVSRERLARIMFGDGDRIDSNAIEVHVHNLRKLIGRDRILTVRGFGYRLRSQ